MTQLKQSRAITPIERYYRFHVTIQAASNLTGTCCTEMVR
jgi:hypothetical protein